MTSMAVFALFFLGPSNPARPACDAMGRCTPERLAALERQMGLDQSVVTQYGAFVGGLFRDRTIRMGGEYQCEAPCLGISFGTREEVSKELVERFPATMSVSFRRSIGGSAAPTARPIDRASSDQFPPAAFDAALSCPIRFV